MKKTAAAGALLALLFLAAGWNIRYVDVLTGAMLTRTEHRILRRAHGATMQYA